AIPSPTTTTTATGPVTRTATASENIAVARVQFILTGAPLGLMSTVPPYTAACSTTGLANGNYVIAAQALDLAGNFSNVVQITLVVNTTPPLPAGLVLWLPFNEASGATANDASGNANTGTIREAVRVAGK